MRFSVTSDPAVWQTFLNGFSPPFRDIYFTHDYINLSVLNSEGIGAAAIFEGDRGVRAIYPFLICKIPNQSAGGQWSDIQTPYGYGGPLVEGSNASDLAFFHEAHSEWCRANAIVAEFVRFHPLLGTHLSAPPEMLVERNRPTVIVDLRSGYNAVFRGFTPARQRNIRKASRARLDIFESQDITTFYKLYHKTMERIGASPYYLFSPSYFSGLARLIPEKCIIFEARHDGTAIASAVFLKGAGCLHYHLGGSDRNELALSPNDFLMSKAMEWAIENGFQSLHLGGGATTSADDSLLRFKSGFAPASGEFFIGKRIHHRDKYDSFMADWRRRTGRSPRKFLAYHDV